MTIDVARQLAPSAEAEDPRISSPLARLRLLVALDALLVEGGVSRAGARLGLGAPAMSRLLAQLRDLFDDPILIRAGRSMVPTPFAEALRPRVRALAAEAETLLTPEAATRRAPLDPTPPLGFRPEVLLEGAPRPEDLARRLAALAEDPAPVRRLARHIATIGAGAAGSRPLTLEEAQEAFGVVLRGVAHPVQIGALLVTMQHRGLTAPELAGLVAAARAACRAEPTGSGRADLDWPAYLSPRTPSAPWFLHAARLVAQAGWRVLLHGQSGGFAEAAARLAGLPICAAPREAEAALAGERIAFLPLDAFLPRMQKLLGLYGLFEMRSPVNVAALLLNPLGAPASLLGVSGASYRTLHRDAAALLGWPRFTALGASRDVAQFTPFRAAPIIRLVEGRSSELVLSPIKEPEIAPRAGMTSLEYWLAVWTGAARDARAEEIILWTTAVALATVDPACSDLAAARKKAEALWLNRG